ncbi:hypothetical protein [Allocoleopsis franciscana]|uniref:Uncharacterized protein n=1 Tax=Allocoleopsis franciscana PCC 7113 TaxID=1173027 RepID=K9WAA6_9CYAN|nr:hypothetical protein [Allocoleopsis franciscana]AFZ16746.1 hypothetical protein Mic7113_0843 [Allocoleopsis franciscana PCC 7113]
MDEDIVASFSGNKQQAKQYDLRFLDCAIAFLLDLTDGSLTHPSRGQVVVIPPDTGFVASTRSAIASFARVK